MPIQLALGQAPPVRLASPVPLFSAYADAAAFYAYYGDADRPRLPWEHAARLAAIARVLHQEVADLVRCVRLNQDCADTCDATGRILTRQTAPDLGVLRAATAACATTCRACREECERHAHHHEHCRVCAEACARCQEACEALLGTIDQANGKG